MKILKYSILVLMILLSLAAGAAKVMQVPQEVTFFEGIGLSTMLLIPFGIFQVAGAVLATLPKTRKWGAIIMALGFVASAITVFMSGQIGFSLVSLMPAVLSGALALIPWTHKTA